ncbi:hypothetical protein AYO40_01695 [Planctomycetaceae bacterium SCGC AG-212-D15]|nr:hypothetical protein AYO40_01695 [Planctomycetaceae bacterium SCGC AG-212-D15]
MFFEGVAKDGAAILARVHCLGKADHSSGEVGRHAYTPKWIAAEVPKNVCLGVMLGSKFVKRSQEILDSAKQLAHSGCRLVRRQPTEVSRAGMFDGGEGALQGDGNKCRFRRRPQTLARLRAKVRLVGIPSRPNELVARPGQLALIGRSLGKALGYLDCFAAGILS